MQSRLQVVPSSLAFGPLTVGSSSLLTIAVSNVGTAAVTSLTATINSTEFAVVTPCPSTIAAGDACQMTVQFQPSTVGTKSVRLTLNSSDPASPLALPLTGTAVAAGSFILSVDNATASVISGRPASYTLRVSPQSGFAGAVVLTCSPVGTVQYASCSLLPSLLSLSSGTAQTSVATVNTITSVTSASTSHTPAAWWALLLPAGLSLLARRRYRGLAMLMLLVALAGCGSSRPDINLHYTPAGSYQFQVTATSLGSLQITQGVTLNLSVTPR